MTSLGTLPMTLLDRIEQLPSVTPLLLALIGLASVYFIINQVWSATASSAPLVGAWNTHDLRELVRSKFLEVSSVRGLQSLCNLTLQ